MLRGRTWEALCLTVFLVLAGSRLFVRPILGLSDNNDFSKVLGPAKVCRAPLDTLNTFFVSDYDAGPNCYRASGLVSSEVLFVRVARALGRPFTGRNRFDIRFSAGLHLAVLGTAFWLLLTCGLNGLARFLVPVLAIAIFTDTGYLAYLNSAFMDNAAMVLCLLLVALWTGRGGNSVVLAIVGVGLVCSKAQHLLVGLPFAVLAIQRRRGLWPVSAAILAATIAMPLLTPSEYGAISLFNVIFKRIAVKDPAALAELGLDSSYSKWTGTGAFSPGSPLSNEDWTREFLAGTSFGTVARFYVAHPGMAAGFLDDELHDSVHSIRPSYFANYRREDGFAPNTQASDFTFWTDLRSRALYLYPYHLVLLFAGPFVLMAVPGARGSRFLPLAIAVASAGILEFAVCTLADGLDTHRHLFLFHVLSEVLILMTVGWFASFVPVSYHGSSHEASS